jgi:hypothetical protein
MDAHFLGLTGGPLDIGRGLIMLMIGIAGGFILAEVRLEPLKQALRRVVARKPDGEGPWR